MSVNEHDEVSNSLKENQDHNQAYSLRSRPTGNMRSPNISKKKRNFKSEELNPTSDAVNTTGLRSPKPSPRRTPKKRKNKNAEKHNKHNHQLRSLADRKNSNIDDNKACIDEKVPDNLINDETKIDEGFDEGYNSSFIDGEKPYLDSSFSKDIKDCAVHSSPCNSDNEINQNLDLQVSEDKQDIRKTREKLTAIEESSEEEVADGDVENCTQTETHTSSTLQQTDENSGDLYNLGTLNNDFRTKLVLSEEKSCSVRPVSSTQAIQTEPDTKRRKVINKACQITDEAVATLNKRLLRLRDKMNKTIVESDTINEENVELKRSCDGLRTERLSLQVQTEALQTECVKKMHDNDQLNLKVDKKECHVQTLKETLLMRDKEINTFHKQLQTGTPQQLTDYRELEMLRIDNIRLLHDNRALTATLDSLNGQLCALRRISKTGEECDTVILMNKRLAEDNNNLTCNFSGVKRELRNLAQDHEEMLEELRYIRGSYKRTLSERDSLQKCVNTASPGQMLRNDNEALVEQNEALKQSTVMLSEQIQCIHDELTVARSTRDAALTDIDAIIEEKLQLQTGIMKIENNNSDLWCRVGELRQKCSEQTDTNNKLRNENSMLISENEELGKCNDDMQAKLEKLQKLLDSEVDKNAELARKINHLTTSLEDASLSVSDLKTTMEFLQVEHSFIESDVERKDKTIDNITLELEELQETKQTLITKCKMKLREKNRKLNASRIKLGYALLEMRALNSHGSESSS